jgi:RNA polymerase sigma-70 factor (ECF subfamily)
MTDRTNDQWLADLQAEGATRAKALMDLAARLERGLFFYLSHDRSDLVDRSTEELQQMAQDFAQESLIKVLDNLVSFRGESQFLTWATKIASRVAISELRRARWRDYSLDRLTADGEIMPSITSLAVTPDGAASPEHTAEREDALQLIDEAISEALTERQRLALTAIAIDGIPIDQVAIHMGTNRNALYKLLHDARLKLKAHMESQGLSLGYILELFGSG